MRTIVFTIFFASSLLLAPSASAAGDCDTDTDCESYETCEVVGEATCACPPGDAGCECPDTGTEEFKECVPEPPDPCESDAECSGDLVCVTQTYEECTGGGSAGACEVTSDGGMNCLDVGTTDVSESCETITEGYCLPSYLAPCQTDTDCGTGFTCQTYEVCECSGGGSTGSGGTGGDGADAGRTTDDAGSSCTCEPAGKACELVETECTSDADCSGDLTCQTYADSDVGSEPCVDDGDTTSCGSVDAGSAGSTEYCLPPDWERWSDVAGDVGVGGPTSDEDRESGGDAGANVGLDAGDGNQSGANADSESNTDGGCSSAGEGAPISGLAMVLVGMLGLTLRRRR
jgi:MYXO-CTERM domain-containing protein